MQITKEQLKEIIVENVTPLLEAHGKKMEDVQTEVDEKIKAYAEQLALVPSGIVVGEEGLDRDKKGGFKCLSHFAEDVFKAEINPNKVLTPELQAWLDHYKAADSTTLLEGEDQYGGFLIPEEYRTDLWMALEAESPIYNRCTRIPIKGTSVRFPYVNGFDESGGTVWGGIQWSWLDELADKSATRPKFGMVRLELKKLAGLAFASDEILRDSPVSLETIFKKGFTEGLDFELSRVVIRGSGAGQPLGILSSPPKVRVSKETGQAADTIVYENILKMYSRLYRKAAALWLVNEECQVQLATMHLAVGTGGLPVYMPANGAAGMPLETLMGKPIVWCKHCSTLGTEGDIMLVDLSQYLLGLPAGQASGGEFATSVHLKFDADQTAFRFVFRVDGQPWWSDYYTPPQATSHTMSPFITLEDR